MAEHTQVTVENHPEHARYEAVDGSGVRAGVAYYERREDAVVVFTHTEVDDAFEGHGVGSQLVRAALDDVRAQGASVIAVCPFVKAWIGKHPDYQDLLS